MVLYCITRLNIFKTLISKIAGSPSKSGFQLVDLSDAEAVTSNESNASNGNVEGVAGVTFDPSMSVITSPALRTRRDSASSSVSDVSGLFPIYEVPGVSFNMPQVKALLHSDVFMMFPGFDNT